MIIISQDNNMIININDLKNLEFVKVVLDYEETIDSKGYPVCKVSDYEYVFYINNKIFGRYSKEYEGLAFEIRDMLIESIIDNCKFFKFIDIRGNYD